MADAIPAQQSMQYQAELECKYDPCTYCHMPAHTFTVKHPDGPFNTPEAAYEHGRAQARLVWGTEHHVWVSGRPVGPWARIDLGEPQ